MDYGNAYVWIRQEYTPKKYGGDLKIKDFWIMDSKSVNVYVLDDGALVYQYTDWITKQVYYFNQDEVLHFKTSATFDGITGKPVREILKDTINTNFSSQKFLNELNENGVSARLTVSVDADVTESDKKKLVKRLAEFSSGIKNAGKVIPIPAGMRVQPLDIKLTDAQFLEIRKYTALQIASAFGVKPDMINDYSKSSYNSSEKPVREILKDTINTNFSSQKFLNELNENGVSARLTVSVDADVTESDKKKLVKRLAEFSSGIKNAGKVIPIPAGMRVQPLDIKLTDAQFLEIRKYTALQIASAFGVKPDMINDYSKSSYNSSEAQQLSFYVDTLQFILKQYEDELNYKLLLNREIKEGYFFKFNEKVLLRTDSSTQAEMLAKLVNNGIYTPNEARRKLDLNGIEYGDKLMMNGNYIPIEQVGEQYKKGGDTN